MKERHEMQQISQSCSADHGSAPGAPRSACHHDQSCENRHGRSVLATS